MLPQLLVGSQLQAWTYKLPLYRRAAVARILAFVTVIGAVFAAAGVSHTVSLWLIVICYSVYNLGGGTSTLAWRYPALITSDIPGNNQPNIPGLFLENF